MLLKTSITGIKIHSEQWFNSRIGKFTSSEIHYLMDEKPMSPAAISFIYRKVGEEISGLPCRDDIDTQATRHGNLYEPEALKIYAERNNLPYLVTQTLISPPDSRFSGTPDALIIKAETETHYSVETLEVKCPYSYDGYIKLFLCNTPEDVLKTEKKYFWQVIDQMTLCDALMGYLIIYQPLFKSGQMKVIPFRKLHLLPFFDKLKQRKIEAENKFIEIRDKLLNS